MPISFKTANIIDSFKLLKGNTRISVMFEPMWGIPYTLYYFYLSLYMKGQGITDRQIGYLIAIGFISSTIFSLLAGVITDRLGRKKTTLIFDLIGWPGSIVLYAISDSFPMFALATIVNSTFRIVSVSFNLMVVEDADNDQRKAAFNLLNIINISAGIITPAAGLIVGRYGIIKAERAFLIFAAVSMTIMMLLRNRYYKETEVGQKILDENKKHNVKVQLKNVLHLDTINKVRQKPFALLIICALVLFNIYIAIGSFSSLYFAPYMTEVLGIDKSAISILAGVNSAAMITVFIFINPVISRYNALSGMMAGLIMQISALFLLALVPGRSLIAAVAVIALLGSGFGIVRPFIDSALAEVTEGNDRASIYALVNTAISILSAVMGLVSGYIYVINPRFLYIAAALMLIVSLVFVAMYKRRKGK